MTTLAEFDTAFERLAPSAMTPEAFAALPARWLSNGFYTLTFPSGEFRTFRVRLDREGLFAGRRTLALLIGPNNGGGGERGDYETLGTVAEDGFQVFKRFGSSKTSEHAELLWRLARGESVAGYELLVSRRCRLCNRKLTDPVSIATEVGPFCRKAVGL